MQFKTLLTIFALKPVLHTKETFYPFSSYIDIGCDPPHIAPDNPNVLKNITRNIWLQNKLNELEGFTRSNKDKLEIAKEVFDLFDDDIISRLTHNIKAGGLLEDWNFDIVNT